MPRPHFTPGKDSVPILQEAAWAPGSVWTGRKSRPHRDSIPDRPARSQSLYWLSYPAHACTVGTEIPHLSLYFTTENGFCVLLLWYVRGIYHKRYILDLWYWLFQDSALDLYNAGVNHQEIILLLENSTDADSSQAFQSMYQYVVDLSTTRYVIIKEISSLMEQENDWKTTEEYLQFFKLYWLMITILTNI